MADFNKVYKTTMGHEGGYVDDPADKGGETYKGIARRYNPGWDGWKQIEALKMKDGFPGCLKKSRKLQNSVKRYYKQHYWDKFWGDEIPSRVLAEELFDTSVNMGVSRAVRYLQVGLNVLNRNGKLFADLVEDGRFGVKTLKAVKIYLKKDRVDPLFKIMNILQGMHYINYMQKSPIQERFARGWLKRVEFVKERHLSARV